MTLKAHVDIFIAVLSLIKSCLSLFFFGTCTLVVAARGSEGAGSENANPEHFPCTAILQNQHCNPAAQLLTAALGCGCQSAEPLSPCKGRRGRFGALGFSGYGTGFGGLAALLRSSCLLWPGCLKISWCWDTGQRSHSHTLKSSGGGGIKGADALVYISHTAA